MAVTYDDVARQTAAARRLLDRGLLTVGTRPLHRTLARDAHAYASCRAVAPVPPGTNHRAGEVADGPSHQSSRPSPRQLPPVLPTPAPVVAPVGPSAS